MAELMAARRASTANMLELRLDGVAALDVTEALHGRELPAIVTCRPPWEGGRFDGSEAERQQILRRALELGAEYIDVEWRALHGAEASAFRALVARDPARVLLSSHDFDGVPADLDARVRAMRDSGARTIKIAVAAARLTDTLRLIDIARAGDAVVVGMGEAGVPSRLLAARYGSRWTYGGAGIAPGQLPVARMVNEFRFPHVGPRTRLFGVVSRSAMDSASPAMHNAAFEAAGLDAVYVPLQAADLDDFLAYAAALGIEGASVTIPFKVAALRAAARADELTRRVGAANTLRRAHAPSSVGWEAANTDVEGFLEPLDAAVSASLHGARAAVLGAGGAARAVIVGLLSRGARVTVHARHAEQARDLAQALGAAAGEWPPPPGSWDLLVNCTPVGGAASRHESPLPAGVYTGRLVYDLTYGPGESELLRQARQAGCPTIDGLPMLVAQAERQFEWWTGRRPPAGVMREAARARRAGERSRPAGPMEMSAGGAGA